MSKTKAEIPDLCGELLASLKVPRLEDENAALTRRVAELEDELRIAREDDPAVVDLESQLSNLSSDYAALLCQSNAFEAECNSLRSQLAWTPVAKGLPTEPGCYEFIAYARPVSLMGYPLHAAGWETIDGLAPSRHANYTHFRRITLPEAT